MEIINPLLRAENSSLIQTEDIFLLLSEGKKFSKPDMAQVCLQMEEEEESFLTTINTEKGLFQCNQLVFGAAPSITIW